MSTPVQVARVADCSSDRSRRYRLGRFWGEGPVACVIGLNPSKANETTDDATNRRLMGLLSAQGFDGYWLVNLLPEVQTDPRQVQFKRRRLSLRNRRAIQDAMTVSHTIIAAWGHWGARIPFRHQVLALADETWCFGVTADGEPRHPLYLPNHSALSRYT